MFFTLEDYRKIKKWLLANSVKDTEFARASLPLKGDETVAFVQDGKNVNVFLKDLIKQIFLLGVSDFLNVTDEYGESRISLTQAIQLVPCRSRKIGQVITFLDEDGEWKLFQFQGEKVNQWDNATLWVDLIKRAQGTSIIDSEDITATVYNLNQTSLTFADKNYNTADYSGLGRVYLRKNIVDVEDDLGETKRMNLLQQSMLSKENTIYIIQYDYDLNSQEITIPENCVLKFEGGSLNNGTLVGTNTLINSSPYFILNNIILSGQFYSENWFLEWVSKNNLDFSEAFNILYSYKFPKSIKLVNSEYVVKSSFNIDSDTILDGNWCTIKSEFEDYYDYIIQMSNCSNIIINNLIINQSEVQDCSSNMNGSNIALVHRAQVIRAYDVKDLYIKNCSFYYFGVNAIAVDSATRPEGVLRIDGCSFYFRRGNSNYDASTIYAACTTNIITNNYINGRHSIDSQEEASTPSFCGIELHSPNSTLTDNTIVNCGNAVNVTPGDHSGTFLGWRGYLISNNTMGNCGKGIQLWCYGHIESSESNFKDINIINNIINIGPSGGTALSAIGIASPSNGSVENINVSSNIIRYLSQAAYHEQIYIAPGINFSGDAKVSNLNIDSNTIINSPANAILVNHTEGFKGKNINIYNNKIVDCRWRSGYSIPNSDSYHYPISVTYCDTVNIENNSFYYTVNPTTNTYGLFFINDCTDVKVINNEYENTTKALLGGIDTNCISEIFTDDVVTKAYYYKDYPNNFVSNHKIYNSNSVCQLFIGDKLLNENGTLSIALDTYNNGNDYMFNGTSVNNSRIIWINRIPKFLKLGTVLKANNPDAGLVGNYVVSMISIDNQCMFLYKFKGISNLNTTFETYKGTLINEDNTLVSKVTII